MIGRPSRQRSFLFLTGCLLFGLVLLAGPDDRRASAADQVAATSLTDEDRADLARVETYLNGISTLQSGFVQVAADGGVAQGKIYISRPGKMRVEYDPPAKVLLVATGVYVIYYDGELDQTTYLPQRATPASLLLKDDIQLDEDVNVTGIERGPGVLRVSVTESDNDEGDGGAITLTFSDKPLELKQWVVKDGQGKLTKLALLNPRFGDAIPPERFLFISPSAD